MAEAIENEANYGGTSSDAHPHAAADSDASGATAGKHGCGSGAAATGMSGVASARGIAADAIGPYDGSNCDDPSASFEKLLRQIPVECCSQITCATDAMA